MSRPTLRAAVAGAAALAVTATLGATIGAAPATSAASTACPQAYPVDQLRSDISAADQAGTSVPVHGSTVSRGTTPEPFTGTAIGVLDDGIAPGVDLVLVRLTSPEIDRVGGIWEGMSGSPVYAADGDLIGAVSYGLSYGPSPVAGVTPAADMQALLGGGSTAATPARKVVLTRSLARKVVASGAATPSEVAGGYSPIRTPMVVSGLRAGKRLNDLGKALHLDGRLMAGSASTTSSPAYDIVPGGNLVASISYGDVTAAAVGTATAVCGNDVIGFGHPFNFAGKTSYAMQGADAVYVQEDSLGAPFKLANLGAPVGTVTGDHLAGIAGTLDSPPKASPVTSSATFGSRSRTGSTYVVVPDAMPDLAASTMVAEQDRVLDYVGKGSGRASWTITGHRSNGSEFQVKRTDYYDDPYDISYATAGDLYSALYRIASSSAAPVIDSVTTSSKLDDRTGGYRIQGVQARDHGVWHHLARASVVKVKAGTTRLFRVRLASSTWGARELVVGLRVPRGLAGLRAPAAVIGAGGQAGGGEEFLYFDSSQQEPLGSVLNDLADSPQRDQVLVRLGGGGPEGSLAEARRGTGHVVTGHRSFRIRVIR